MSEKDLEDEKNKENPEQSFEDYVEKNMSSSEIAEVLALDNILSKIKNSLNNGETIDPNDINGYKVLVRHPNPNYTIMINREKVENGNRSDGTSIYFNQNNYEDIGSEITQTLPKKYREELVRLFSNIFDKDKLIKNHNEYETYRIAIGKSVEDFYANSHPQDMLMDESEYISAIESIANKIVLDKDKFGGILKDKGQAETYEADVAQKQEALEATKKAENFKKVNDLIASLGLSEEDEKELRDNL